MGVHPLPNIKVADSMCEGRDSTLRSEEKIKFKCPFTNIAKIKKSSFYRGVDLWNSLKVQHHKVKLLLTKK